jgi:hypothetical protein
MIFNTVCFIILACGMGCYLSFMWMSSNIRNFHNHHNLSKRIDGIQERIDNLRDMIMQKQENDMTDLKKKINV